MKTTSASYTHLRQKEFFRSRPCAAQRSVQLSRDNGMTSPCSTTCTLQSCQPYTIGKSSPTMHDEHIVDKYHFVSLFIWQKYKYGEIGDFFCVTTGNRWWKRQGAIIKAAFPSEIVSLGNIKKASWQCELCSGMTTKLWFCLCFPMGCMDVARPRTGPGPQDQTPDLRLPDQRRGRAAWRSSAAISASNLLKRWSSWRFRRCFCASGRKA